MVAIGPNGNPVCKQKGQKTRISPYKRTIAYAELLAIVCGVNKSSILKYFSNEGLTISNPRAVRKFLDNRVAKFGNLQGKKKKNKTDYKFKGKEIPIQGPTYPTKLS